LALAEEPPFSQAPESLPPAFPPQKDLLGFYKDPFNLHKLRVDLNGVESSMIPRFDW
jgi:hypothetical protein